MKNFFGIGAKSNSYLIGNGSEDKKAKGRKQCVKKRKRKFENYKNCLEATQLKNKINHLQIKKLSYRIIKKKSWGIHKKQ